MAIANNGPGGAHRGRIGKIVYYMLNGQQVSREIGYSNKPPTDGQLGSRLGTKLCSEFLESVKDFIMVGFGIAAQGTTSNAFNIAVKYNRSKVIQGSYPNLVFDYAQVVLTAGSLKAAHNWQVTETPDGLRYSWDTDPQMPWPEATDQVMMLAYFPQKRKAVYTLFGNSRLSGSDVLEIPPGLQGEHMETYLSFVAADRKQLGNSVYTGSFNSGQVIALLSS